MIMANCCICGKEVSGNPFSTKDKFELLAHAFICRECAAKIGINSMWAANRYTAEKAKNKYYEMFPEEAENRRGTDNVDPNIVRNLLYTGQRGQAYKYIKETAGVGQYGVAKVMTEIEKNDEASFLAKLKSIPLSNITWAKKEALFLRTLLYEDEEVLHTVSGIMKQNGASVSGNNREIAVKDKPTQRSWLLVLTDRRIILINRHLLVGTECIEIPLSMVNSISLQMRIVFATIVIMHGSAGIYVDEITKPFGAAFVSKANAAMEKIRNSQTDRIVSAVQDLSNPQTISAADEIRKYKELLDMGAITPEEYEMKKKQLLGL